ncbi:MAG: Ig-like domain-containing protein [Exilibacterium sp.]
MLAIGKCQNINLGVPRFAGLRSVGILAVLLVVAPVLEAYEREGVRINEQCEAANRVPEQPYNSRDPRAGNGCFLCHDAGEDGLEGKGRAAFETGNLDFFCTLNLTNMAPKISIVGPRKISVEEPLGIVLKADDGDGDELSFYAVNLPRGARIEGNGDGTATFDWTPTRDQAGTYKVIFLVSDSGSPTAVDSALVRITVSDGNTPPLLTPVGNRVVEEGRELRIQLSASDKDGDDIFFQHSGLPWRATFVDNGDGTALFSWTPAAESEGAYPINVVVSDGLDTDEETLVILVTYVSARETSQ